MHVCGGRSVLTWNDGNACERINCRFVVAAEYRTGFTLLHHARMNWDARVQSLRLTGAARQCRVGRLVFHAARHVRHARRMTDKSRFSRLSEMIRVWRAVVLWPQGGLALAARAVQQFFFAVAHVIPPLFPGAVIPIFKNSPAHCRQRRRDVRPVCPIAHLLD